MKSLPFVAPFPIGGVSERYGYAAQSQGTTPEALNVFPTDWTTGRERGGTRPGRVAFGSNVGARPYGWCPVSYVTEPTSGNFVTNRGVAVCTASGTYTHTAFNTPATSWTQRIATSPASDFATCEMFLQTLVQTSTGQQYPQLKWMSYGSNPWSADGDLDTVVGAYNTANTPDPLLPRGNNLPQYCGLVAIHNGRLVFSGSKKAPHIVYMSRTANPVDYDFSAIDVGGAIATSTGLGGRISEPVTALITHNQDCLLVGCTDSLYVIRGNLRAGGQIYVLSHTHGPLMQSAWCKTGNEWTFLLTREGLFRMPPGCGVPMEPASTQVLPDDLVGINPGSTLSRSGLSGDRVAMGYDARFRGIHIYTWTADGGKKGWFHDLQSGGFWPILFGTGETWTGGAIELCVPYKATMTANRSGLLLIDQAGNTYVLDRSDTSDSFTAKLTMGPLDIGGSPHTEGVLASVGAVLSEASGEVAWDAVTADSAQQAFLSPSQTFTGDPWDVQGLNYLQHPRVRGVSGYLKLSSSGTTRWQTEEVFGIAEAASMRRVD